MDTEQIFKPFVIGWNASFWTTKDNKAQEVKGKIIDGYYQEKTKDRREGWRILLRRDEPSSSGLYEVELYLDELMIKN